MQIEITELSDEEVFLILSKGDCDFSPTLSQCIDVKEYARKLSSKADFVIIKDNKEYVGCIAYYKNQHGGFVYISHYWVNSRFQGHHFGRMMLEKLIATVKDNYDEIMLEVLKDNKARYFYLNHGFMEKEDRGPKLLLALNLRNICNNCISKI